jgi:type IV pilus assembly protein PilB
MSKTFVEKLADIFIEQKIATEKEASAMRRGFKESGKEQFDDFLLEEGLITVEDLLKSLSIYYDVPSFDASDAFFQTHLLHMFPKDFLLRNGVIPLEVEQNMLFVVASDPNKDGLESDLRGFVSYDIEFYVGIDRDICDAVKEFYDKAVTQVSGDEDLRTEHELDKEEKLLEDEGDDAVDDQKFRDTW